MPPILHPRSRSTSGLFAATMVASFVIVGLPHIFPCPAPRRTLADSQFEMTADGQQILRSRRRRRNPDSMSDSPEGPQYPKESVVPNGAKTRITESTSEEITIFYEMEAEAEALAQIGRECPVPKPRGIIGQLLGFSNNSNKTEGHQQQPSQPTITTRENGS